MRSAELMRNFQKRMSADRVARSIEPSSAKKIEEMKTSYAKKESLDSLREDMMAMFASLGAKIDGLAADIQTASSEGKAFAKTAARRGAEATYEALFEKLQKTKAGSVSHDDLNAKIKELHHFLGKEMVGMFNKLGIQSMGNFQTVGESLTLNSGNYLYLGNPGSDGSWRISISGTDLIAERRESSAWVNKGGFTA